MIWGWKGPQRIRAFLWIIPNGGLLTNCERVRRHLSEWQVNSGLCNNAPESVLHVLRDCFVTSYAWKGFLKRGMHDSTGTATAGGLIRDYLSRWQMGFAVNLGKCSVIIAENRGILEGLKLAQNLGVTLIQVECDNLVAVQMISGDIPSPPALASLISRTQHLLNQVWPCLLQHVYREANYAADFMADYGKQFPFGVHHVLRPPG